MSRKRVSLTDRIEEENKAAKAVSAYISTNEDVSNKSNEDISGDVETYINDNGLEDVSVSGDGDTINTVDDNVNNTVDDNVNPNTTKIVIRKQEKQEIAKRTTYYLLPSTIKKIEKLSKATGVGKSALVQKLLDEALNLVEIK